ncbi:MAG: restriction endonuclease subunit S [Nitrospirae bacterium]|nr:restriction endonuclease subunit S [Nitrospirota bacterium]
MPMASVKDLTRFGISFDTCRHISEEDYQKLIQQNCKPEIGDVLISKDGASALDTVCEIKKSLEVVLLSSVAILRPNAQKISSSFLRYYLDAESTRQYMKNAFTTGAAIPRVVLKDFKKVRILVPPMPVQHKIASILSAYDDLIENNNRRIKILEEMAQAIYREWFVNFRFPGHEKVKRVKSELGMIPEGWEVKTLVDICTIVMGQSPKSEFYNEDGNGLPFHQGVTDFGDRFPTTRIYSTVQNRIAEAGDILFSVRAPVARINIANKKMVIGRGLCAIRSRTANQFFVFQQLKDKFQETDTMGGGTIFKSVTKEDVHSIKMIEPSNKVLTQFEEIIKPVFSKLEILTNKNFILRKTRDLLLPKLISGEIDVEGMEMQTSANGV